MKNFYSFSDSTGDSWRGSIILPAVSGGAAAVPEAAVPEAEAAAEAAVPEAAVPEAAVPEAAAAVPEVAVPEAAVPEAAAEGAAPEAEGAAEADLLDTFNLVAVLVLDLVGTFSLFLLGIEVIIFSSDRISPNWGINFL